jgi:hypothetical protein
MKFCPICKFMLYTKIKSSQVQENEEDEDRKSSMEVKEVSQDILQYYCKNCAWSKDELVNETSNAYNCVYKRNYQEDYIVEKTIANKYTIYDNTLPRVSYDCINDGCITNQSDINNDEIFNEKNSLIVDNIPPDYTDDQVTNIFANDFDTSLIYKAIRVKLTKYIILFNTPEAKELFEVKYNNAETNDYKLKIIKYEKPRKEVIYIKYDSINMKYLYICANCGTSWKKN